MLLRFFASLVYLLLILVTLWTGATATSELTVDLIDEEARNKEYKRATPVCSVIFILPANHKLNVTKGPPPSNVIMNNFQTNYTVDRTNETEFKIMAYSQQDTSVSYTFNITFDSSRQVGCHTYLPDLSYTHNSPNTRLVNCTQIFACNVTSTNGEPTWYRLESEEELLNFRDSVTKNEWTAHLTNSEMYSVSFEDSNVLFDIVGYYLTTFEFNGSNVTGDYFTIYLNPESFTTSGDQEVIFGTGRARNFMSMYCNAKSFPYTTATWESPSGSNFTMTDRGSPLGESSNTTADLTIGGQLVFDDVQYGDHGDYRCTVRHPISGEEVSTTLRLRVRNPLRPLWPFLGILGSFAITLLFIAGGAIVDKIRGKKGADDDNEGSFERNYSIVSNLGDEGNEGRLHTRRHHAAGKRVSITQQELLSDTN